MSRRESTGRPARDHLFWKCSVSTTLHSLTAHCSVVPQGSDKPPRRSSITWRHPEEKGRCVLWEWRALDGAQGPHCWLPSQVTPVLELVWDREQRSSVGAPWQGDLREPYLSLNDRSLSTLGFPGGGGTGGLTGASCSHCMTATSVFSPKHESTCVFLPGVRLFYCFTFRFLKSRL